MNCANYSGVVAAYASRGMTALNDLSCAAMPVRSSCWNR
jgi:hypothetical protein